MPARKQIKKARLNARCRVFHGNKALEQRQRLKMASYGFCVGLKMHEPEPIEQIEKETLFEGARDLRKPASSDDDSE